VTELDLVPFEDLPEGLRTRAEAAQEITGDTRFLQALGNAPHMAEFYFRDFYENVFHQGIVPVRVKELVRLRLSNLHGCVF